MNIILIGPFGLRPRGTMAVRALPLARALVARGHAVTVLLPPWQNPEDGGRCWQENGVDIENIALPPAIPGLYHLLVALRLARRALALRPDVVHLFKPKAYSGLVHWLLARLPRGRRPRLVVDTDDWEGPGGWNDLAPYTPAQRAVFTWQERWGLTHADAVTVASRALQSLVWAMGIPAGEVHYVPNGIDCRLQSADCNFESAICNPQFVILLYTRFFEFPVSRVVELLLRVRQEVPDARLLVVGKGLFDEERELERLAAQANLTLSPCPPLTLSPRPLPSDINLAGWVDPQALPLYFAQATLAIYTFDDTLVNRCKCPVKLLDLLAAGVAVIAEDVGEIGEMIHHGESGWLVEPGDVTGFAAAVVRLLRAAPLRERLGQAAAADMRARRDWARLAAEVEQAYGAGA